MATHLFPSDRLEVGTGKPGYRWVPGYAEALPRGRSMSMTRHQWYAIARRDGLKLVWHSTEAEARKAAEDSELSL